ncbi:MAG: hypothetical protein LBC84_06195 [Prevotellaceae bacterium]|jgi:hypothetical protein|nr:hypothetical protein [Prevotellaceae bacterium]
MFWKKKTKEQQPVKEKNMFFNSIDEAAEYIFRDIEEDDRCVHKRPLEQIKKDLYLITIGDLRWVNQKYIWQGYILDNFRGTIEEFVKHHLEIQVNNRHGVVWRIMMQKRYPQMGDFTNFDEAAKYQYDIVREDSRNLRDRPLETIKSDLISMTNGDISKVGFPLLPRYVEAYAHNCLDGLISWYAGVSKTLEWGIV